MEADLDELAARLTRRALGRLPDILVSCSSPALKSLDDDETGNPYWVFLQDPPKRYILSFICSEPTLKEPVF